MRYFPSAAGRCVLAACVFLATLVGLVIPLAHAADGDDLKDKQKDVQSQIDQATFAIGAPLRLTADSADVAVPQTKPFGNARASVCFSIAEAGGMAAAAPNANAPPANPLRVTG